MEEIIHFRTKFSRNISAGSASKYILGRSSEASELRNALPYDDARDIVWNRSTGTTLITRNRFTQSSIHIHLTFGDEIFDREKWAYIENIKKSIEHSARFSGDDFFFEDSQKLMKSRKMHQEKGRLIFYVTSSIDVVNYKKISTMFPGNDIIILMLFHPYELERTGNSIFDSRIPTHDYYIEITKRVSNIEKILHSMKISNIVVRTDDNIIRKLNHYFKHRYG